MPDEKIKILVGIPTMGSLHPLLVSSMLGWARHFKGDQINFYFTFRVAGVERARNQIVDYFLKGDFTHLFFVDSDTIPTPDALTRLLGHQKDIVSGMTPILKLTDKGEWETFDNCFVNAERDEKGKIIKTYIAKRNVGLVKIFRCGTACLLIRRDVFEKIAKPYFKFDSNEDGTQHKRSEDIYFCDSVREKGLEIYADTDVICQHAKDIII